MIIDSFHELYVSLVHSSLYMQIETNIRTIFLVSFLCCLYLRSSDETKVLPIESAQIQSYEAAGILPITQDHNKNWYLVLGFDMTGFSDFGGEKNPGENPIDTAKREFAEESGITNLKLPDQPEYIINNEYYMYVLTVAFDKITKHDFRETCDQEKTAFALFPLKAFVMKLQNRIIRQGDQFFFDEYLIRDQFVSSLTMLSKAEKSSFDNAYNDDNDAPNRKTLLLYDGLDVWESKSNSPRIFPTKENRLLLNPIIKTTLNIQNRFKEIDQTPTPKNPPTKIKTPKSMFERLCNKYSLTIACIILGTVLIFKIYYGTFAKLN